MTTLAELAHEKHLRLGIRSANCAACQRPVPEWVRRALASRLPAKAAYR